MASGVLSASRRVTAAGSRRWSRLGVVRGLFGAGGKEGGDGKRAKRTPKFRIDNLADLNELRRTGGKQWQASDSVTPPEVSPLFPPLSGVTLSGHPTTLPGNLLGNVSLISVFMKNYGKSHCEKYSRPYMVSFGLQTDTAVFELSLIDMWMYRLMSKWMTRNLAKTMSPDNHDNFMLYSGKDAPEIRKTLQLGNSMIGYVFLLDKEGRIRWKAHASPTEHEIEALLRCSQQLLEEERH